MQVRLLEIDAAMSRKYSSVALPTGIHSDESPSWPCADEYWPRVAYYAAAVPVSASMRVSAYTHVLKVFHPQQILRNSEMMYAAFVLADP